MRIIADKKDYYDCIQAVGQDQSVVYVRKEEEVELGRAEWPFPPLSLPETYSDGIGVDQFIIGFCGKIYGMIKLTHGYVCPHSEKQNIAYCFNGEDVDAFMAAQMSPKGYKIYRKKIRLRKTVWGWYRGALTYQHVAKFFEECKGKQNSFVDMFSCERPVFVADKRGRRYDGVIAFNVMLKPHGFYRVFDPFMAFQEISTFLGGLARPMKDMPAIPDTLKAESKGFNKWSFRTPPLGR